MFRRALPLLGCNPLCIVRNDSQPTFRDIPFYKFKETQVEEREQRDSVYLKMDTIFEKAPVRYAKRVRVDPATLAAQQDREAIAASSSSSTAAKSIAH